MNMVMNRFRYGLLIMAVLVLLSNFCYGKTNNRKDYGLKGSVCAVVVKDIEFSIKFGEVVPTGESNDIIYYFLKDGNVYAEVLEPKKYRRFEYDEHNNLTEEMCVNVGEGKEYWIDYSPYHLNDTTEHHLYQYAYNSEDRLKEIKCFRGKKQYRRIVYNYTTTGKTITYYKEEGIEQEESYNGNIHVTKDYQLKEGVADYVTRETLNDNNKPIKFEVRVGESFGVVNGSYAYNNQGDVIKIVKGGRIQNQQVNSTETMQYVYDKQGNWIKKMSYVDGKLKTWTERDITYAVSDDDYSKKLKEAKMIEATGQKISDMVKHTQDSIQAIKQPLQDSIQALQNTWGEEEGPVATDFDENAKFPGGDAYYNKWFNEHFKYPSEAKENGEQGRVIISFIVECDGSISFVKVLRSPSDILSLAALRLVMSMPKWEPAKKDGQPVRRKFNLPLMYRLN